MADLEERFTKIRAAGQREIQEWEAGIRASRELELARKAVDACAQYAQPYVRALWIDRDDPDPDGVFSERLAQNPTWQGDDNREFCRRWIRYWQASVGPVRAVVGVEFVRSLQGLTPVETIAQGLYLRLLVAEDTASEAELLLPELARTREELDRARYSLQGFFHKLLRAMPTQIVADSSSNTPQDFKEQLRAAKGRARAEGERRDRIAEAGQLLRACAGYATPGMAIYISPGESPALQEERAGAAETLDANEAYCAAWVRTRWIPSIDAVLQVVGPEVVEKFEPHVPESEPGSEILRVALRAVHQFYCRLMRDRGAAETVIRDLADLRKELGRNRYVIQPLFVEMAIHLENTLQRRPILSTKENELPETQSLEATAHGVLRNEGESQVKVPAQPGGNRAGTPPGVHPCELRAYDQYKRAVSERPDLETDDQFYAWVREKEGSDAVPSLETWKRHLRTARAFHKEQKHLPRRGLLTRSVVGSEQLEARDEGSGG